MDEKTTREETTTSAEPAPTEAPPAAGASPGDASATGPVDPEQLESRIVEALKTVYDPEIPVNIYELGLIYGLAVSPDGVVEVRMTLTAPACPAAGTLPGEVESKVKGVPGVKDARVELVWDPPWCKDLMSEAAKLQLGLL